jgi:CheY-like chemotaxis protein
MLTDIHGLMQVRAREKQLPLHIEYDGMLPVSIESDPVRLRQILVNLIGNAIKFTEEGSVTVKVYLVSGGATNQVRFDVIDTGIGIDEQTVGQLFEPFMQADLSDTRRYSGTGLGLAISRRLAQVLGGDISVISTPGVGSTFSVTVSTGPLEGVEIVDLAGDAIVPTPISELAVDVQLTCRVLVVDDRRDIRYLAQHFIEEAGGYVDVAEDGVEAIRKVREAETTAPFDLVVMDMQMPVMDGYEATRQLRAVGYHRPIIALTAGAMQGDREKCIEAGCNDYTSKPVDGSKLVALVAYHLSISRDD